MDNSRDAMLYQRFVNTIHGKDALHAYDMAYMKWLRESGKGAMLEREFGERTREGSDARKNMDALYVDWFDKLMAKIDQEEIAPLPKQE